jgi:hypothetical protein
MKFSAVIKQALKTKLDFISNFSAMKGKKAKMRSLSGAGSSLRKTDPDHVVLGGLRGSPPEEGVRKRIR